MMQYTPKAQAMLEYTIILGVVIGLSVLALALLRPSAGSANTGVDISKSVSLSTQTIGVISHSVSEQGLRLSLKNNYGKPISITTIYVNNEVCNAEELFMQLGLNQQKNLDCDEITNTNIASYYEYEATIDFTDSSTGVLKKGFEGVLTGYVTNIVE